MKFAEFPPGVEKKQKGKAQNLDLASFFSFYITRDDSVLLVVGMAFLPARTKRPDAWCPTYMIRFPFMLNRTGGI